MPVASPSITVVVCSLNGAGTIGSCLDALARQTVRARTQVVVVDDGSTDGTADVARRFGVEVVVHEQNRGISAARNSGIRAARAPIVAFTDDDCVPTESWLEQLIAGYDRDDVVAVGGPIEVHRVTSLVHRFLVDNNPLAPLELELADHTSLPDRLVLYVRRMWGSPAPVGERAVYSFAGANMSFRRDVLEQLGCFDSRMTFGADDEYICRRARERYPDHLLWFTPEAVVRHDFVGTFRDLFRRNFAYGRGHARTYRLDPDHRWPTVFPIPIVVAVLALALALARRRRLGGLLIALGVPVLLPQGVLGAVRHRRLSCLLFSYLRFAEEGAHNAGMLVGLVRDRPGRSGSRGQ